MKKLPVLLKSSYINMLTPYPTDFGSARQHKPKQSGLMQFYHPGDIVIANINGVPQKVEVEQDYGTNTILVKVGPYDHRYVRKESVTPFSSAGTFSGFNTPLI